MTQLNFPNAVRDEKDLFGREIELDRIVDVLTTSQYVPVLLQGERRVGKTSTLNVALSRLKKIEKPQFVPLEIEPRGIMSLEKFAQEIFQRMCSLLGEPLSSTALLDKEQKFHLEDPTQFEGAFLRVLNGKSDLHFVLCVDEFDVIIKSALDELPKIMGLLVSLSERSNLPLSMFFTMTRLPDDLKDSFPTPFTNLVEIVELPLFTDAVAREMIVALLQNEFALSDRDFSLLYKVAGGHPYFTKLLLDNLLRQKQIEQKDVKPTKTMLEQMIKDAEKDPRAGVAVENLYRVHFNQWEKDVIIQLAEQQDDPLTREELRRAGRSWLTAAAELSHRSYLRDDNGQYGWRIGFLGNWLRNWIEFDEEKESHHSLRLRLATPLPIIEVDDLVRQVRISGRPISLSPQEYHIIYYLAIHAGTLVPREEVVDVVWGTAEGVTDQTVDTAFYRLRKKLGEAGDCLQTITGQGFVLNRVILSSK